MNHREIRNPKSEIRKKPEVLNPKYRATGLCDWALFRFSDFGILSVFGFRPSDF
jgi:hypothetical protein